MSLTTALLLLPSLMAAPQLPLQSILPKKPIEDPAAWAWGRHPRDGFGYKAKDGLDIEVCLENPELINSARCSFPLDFCLDNQQFLPQLACAGNTYPLDTCLANRNLFTLPACASHINPEVCATVPSLTLSPNCVDKLVGYQPSLFECSDNKEALCKLNLCGKHQFIVKC